jgi:HipA-like protein
VPWQELITQAAGERPVPINAHTFNRKWGTASQPALLDCDDGSIYVVKGKQNGRMCANEQIVAHLGQLVGAPVPDVAYVNVPQELIARQPQLAHFQAGPGHGSEFVKDCADGGIQYVDGENRTRFARLAVLFGWVYPQNQQFIYEMAAPHLVYSTDHGHFFPNGPNWTPAHLPQAGVAVPDPSLIGPCQLSQDDMRTAASPLVGLQDQAIARAVAAPLDEWGLAMDDRIAVATYLARRRGELLAALGL